MKLSAGIAANAAAWLAIVVLIAGAIVVVDRLGFAGLVVLGGATCLISSLARLDQAVPTWGVDVFKAAMARPPRDEDRAEAADEADRALSPLRFAWRCGAFLAVVGALGFAWQLWRGVTPL